MIQSEFKPGFRISVLDAVVLVVGAVASALAARIEWWMGLIVAFATAHFFLFCNVFRVQRPYELGWSVLFISLAGSTIAFGIPGWAMTVAGSLLGTVALIAMETRKASYHGVLWNRLNPGLEQWWEAQGFELSKNRMDLDEQMRHIVVPTRTYGVIRGCGVVLALLIWAGAFFWGPAMLLVGVIPYWVSIKLFAPT